MLELFNRFDISVSHDEVEREDTDIVQRILNITRDRRVPVPLSINSQIVIHSVVDNFDKKDHKGGSHDTIIMFFNILFKFLKNV